MQNQLHVWMRYPGKHIRARSASTSSGLDTTNLQQLRQSREGPRWQSKRYASDPSIESSLIVECVTFVSTILCYGLALFHLFLVLLHVLYLPQKRIVGV